ncbi:protein encore isoform X2 [Drosophila ficusphila]|uniref:protein encore isoform X2 n=1 Tax=Drosophila ficusphila TaxID=30025 RepID=UPI001C89154C|nr:protein encore isoform X2 [Drosophila ficusphila]
MSSTKSQVALATNIPTNLSSAASASTAAAAAAVVVVASANAAVASNTNSSEVGSGSGSGSGSVSGSASGSGSGAAGAAAATSSSSVITISSNCSSSNLNNNCGEEYQTVGSAGSANLGRQNSFGNRRGNMKGKHLTRSHAMRESTSPPRTPTPRGASSDQQLLQGDSHEHNNNNNNNNSNSNNNNNININSNSKAQSTGRGNSPLMEAPAVIVTSQQPQQQQQQQQQYVPQKPQQNVPLSNEAEFPKLSPPKKSGGQHNRTNSSGSGMEYNNNSNNNASSKKFVVDMKSNGLDNKQQQHNNSSSAGVIYNSGMNYKAAERHERHERHEMSSQNSNLSNNHDEEPYHYEPRGGGGGGGGKKHRANTNAKGNKPRLKNLAGSSSGSIDLGGGGGGGGGGNGNGGNNNMSNNGLSNNSSNNTSGFISRENSSEQYTDYGGTDLLLFFRDTLNKNPKDRNILLKIEKDLMEFVQENSRGCEYRFPPASSYNRMLIHRTAAFFGMEHNVDTETQQCVIVAVAKNTRIPEIRFQSLVRDDARKSILKRDTHSFDEVRQSPYLCPLSLDRKAKSFEERDEDYDRARSRIFSRTGHNHDGYSGGGDEECYGGWEQQQKQNQLPRPKRPNGKMLQMQNSTESRDGMRSGGAVPKSHNFGNYGGPPSSGGPGNNSLPRGDSTNSIKSGRGGFVKQDSTGSTPWRLSPSSSGYKTRTQSVRSDSVTPSPTGYGSDRQTPEFSHPPPPPISAHSRVAPTMSLGGGGCAGGAGPAGASAASPHVAEMGPEAAGAGGSSSSSSGMSGTSGLVWAVTDISNVPIGSLLIDPQTLQPIVNADGSIYHYDPSNLPPNQALQHTGNQYQSQNQGNSSSGGYGNYRKSSPHQQQQQHQQHQQQQHQQQQQQSQVQHQQQVQQPQQQQQQQQQHQQPAQQHATTELSCSSTESYAEEEAQSPGAECSEGYESYEQQPLAAQQLHFGNGDASSVKGDDCDSLTSATACLSITTSTSTKNYDRIEVQKYKNQATSPNIPACCAAGEKLELETAGHQEQEPEEQLAGPSSSGSATSSVGITELPSSQTPLPLATQVNCDLQSVSPSSTPYSQCEVKTPSQSLGPSAAVEEPKTTTWTYTQSYQAPDGSTVFHTTTTPNGAAPYCATTYQQGPDGSIYAVPQGMVYAAYPQPGVPGAGGASQPLFQLTTSSHPPAQTLFASPEAGGELPGGTYMIPVFDPAQPPREGLIPAQAIYQAGPGGPGAATVMPMASAYPTAQFAAAAAPNGGPIYQAPLIYSSEPGGGAQLQQLPMAPYPIQYSYPYYHPISYYVPQPAVAAAPMVASQPPVGQVTPMPQPAPHAGAGAAAGPPTVVSVSGQQHHQPHHHHQQQQHSSNGSGVSSSGYSTRVKRTPGGGSIHYNPSYTPSSVSHGGGGNHHPSAGSAQIIAAPAASTTTYHALPTLTLAHGGAPAGTDLSGAGGAHVYALPAQHATALIPTNIFPYAAAAAAAAAAGAPGGGPAAAPPQMVPQAAPPPPPQSAPHAHTLITAAPFYPASAGTMDPGSSQSAPTTPANPGRQAPLFSTPPAPNNGSSGSSSAGGGGGGGGGGGYHSNSSTPHYYQNQNSNEGYTSPYEKRSHGGGGASVGVRKPYHPGGGYNPRHSVPLGGGIPSGAKTPLLNSNNEPTPRASPSSVSLGGGSSSGGISSYQHRGPPPHSMGVKRDNKPNQLPLISGPPPSYAANSSPGGIASYESKPPMRLNAGAASFRSQKSMNQDYRRSVSQRNSPSANGGGSGSHESSNNSPNSILGSQSNSAANTPNAVAAAQQPQPQPTLVSHSGGFVVLDQATGAAMNASPPSLYAGGGGGGAGVGGPAAGGAAGGGPQPGGGGGGGARSHIPTAQLHHSAAAAAAAAAGSQQATAAVLSGVAAAAALGGYNPNGASGVYFKYGQTYFAHPSVALPNSRRSPSNDIRPQMAQVAGMYPTMMIQARHPSRHPNPNYKGSRPR